LKPAARSPGDHDIAIVGISVRVPGATGTGEFWKSLKAGVESVRQFSDKELVAAGERPELLRHPKYVRAGAPLDHALHFDAEFFGFSAEECKSLDLHHRQLLECTWEALEDAGRMPERVRGPIGVFAGTGVGSYFAFKACLDPEHVASKGSKLLDAEDAKSSTLELMHLSGPRLNLQSACSSSLISVHLACRSLIDGKCTLALAAGIGIDAYQRGYLFREDEVLSPDGHCRAFDHRSRGTVGGSGAGVVALRLLRDALADGDHIYAVIKGSAVSNADSPEAVTRGPDAAASVLPSVEAQARVARAALKAARIEPNTIDYIECHGAGVFRDDAVEIAGLTQAYRRSEDTSGHCRVGSVKTNLGHLDSAAGIVGLIKTCLALYNGQIPPSLHFEAPHSTIDFAHSPFLVNDQLSRWPNRSTPRRAAVHAVGIGGSSAHVVLEEAPERAPVSQGKNPWQLLVLSARSAAALDLQCARLAAHLDQHPEQSLADIAFTLKEGRRAFERRRVLVTNNHQDAIGLLSEPDPSRVVTQTCLPGAPALVFMFSAASGETMGMAKGLYESEPEFRRVVDQGLSYLSSKWSFDSRELFLSGPPHESARENLKRPSVQLPATFILEYALAKLWMAKGVTPTALIGPGMGENTAACLAGVLSYEDAVGLVQLRGALFDTARHSSTPKPTLNEFGDYLNKVELCAPKIPFISNRSGDWISDEQATSRDYWLQQLQAPMLFAQGVSNLIDNPRCVFLELGVADALKWLTQQNPALTSQRVVPSLRPLAEAGDDRVFFLSAVGKLWALGVEIASEQFWPKGQRRRVPLPCTALHGALYPFDPNAPLVAQLSSATPKEDENFDARFYSHVWRQRDLDAVTAKRQSWLVFLDDSETGEQLCTRVLERGDEVIAVRNGKLFYKQGDGEFRLSPADGREEYEALVRDVLASGIYVASGSFLRGFADAATERRVSAVTWGLWGQVGTTGIAAARMGGVERHSAWQDAAPQSLFDAQTSLADALLSFAASSVRTTFGPDDVVRAFERVLMPRGMAELSITRDELSALTAQGPAESPRPSVLPSVVSPELDSQYVEARDDVERALVKIWDELPPLETKLYVNPQALAHTSRGLREEELELVRLTDGERNIGDVILKSGLIELKALERLAWLYGQGLLTPRLPEDQQQLPRPFRTQLGFRAVEPGLATPPPPVASESIIPKFWPPLPSGQEAGPRGPSIMPAPIVAVGKAAETPMPIHEPGVELGRYEVLCRIGRGGMGSAYLCRLRGAWGFEQLFCLKVLREHLITDQRAIELFVGEAKIAARLTHPNIVNIVDVGSADNQPYIVMHYVDGASLAQLLAANGETNPAIVVTVILDALAGLTCAHDHVDENGQHLAFVHCDISPQNILVGVDGSARIADFGVARATHASLSLQDRREPMRGTPAFASPEQLAGSGVDARSDIFSLGAVFWTALTGEELFPKLVGEEALAVRRKSTPNASENGRKPPPYFDEICRKALAFSPHDRFQSAAEFLVALRKAAVVNDLIATPQAVAHWVRTAVGAESEARRSKIAARRLSNAPAAGPVNVTIPPLGKVNLDLVKWSPEAEKDPADQTTVLSPRETAPESIGPELDPRRRLVLYLAAAATLVLVVVAILMPNALRGFVRMSGTYGGTAPAQVAPSTPSATPVPGTSEVAKDPATSPR
jgi:acyl transferase domain-containing protein/serine/threonine protein kinase